MRRSHAVLLVLILTQCLVAAHSQPLGSATLTGWAPASDGASVRDRSASSRPFSISVSEGGASSWAMAAELVPGSNVPDRINGVSTVVYLPSIPSGLITQSAPWYGAVLSVIFPNGIVFQLAIDAYPANAKLVGGQIVCFGSSPCYVAKYDYQSTGDVCQVDSAVVMGYGGTVSGGKYWTLGVWWDGSHWRYAFSYGGSSDGVGAAIWKSGTVASLQSSLSSVDGYSYINAYGGEEDGACRASSENIDQAFASMETYDWERSDWIKISNAVGPIQFSRAINYYVGSGAISWPATWGWASEAVWIGSHFSNMYDRYGNHYANLVGTLQPPDWAYIAGCLQNNPSGLGCSSIATAATTINYNRFYAGYSSSGTGAYTLCFGSCMTQPLWAFQTEVKLVGIAVDHFGSGIPGSKGGWHVAVDRVIFGPQLQGQNVEVWNQAVWPSGYMDPNVKAGEIVQVYGMYSFSLGDLAPPKHTVSLVGSADYYLRILARPKDLIIWSRGSGLFWAKTALSGYNSWFTQQWGSGNDKPIVADVDGDGQDDFVVWSSSSGLFWVKTSSSGFYSQWFTQRWGSGNDIPMVADMDGDDKGDFVVWSSNGLFWVKTSSSGYTSWYSVRWGGPGDVPMVADVDRDGRGDFIVWSSSTGIFWVKTSRSGYTQWFTVPWGGPGDIPMVADVDGDGKADLIVWSPSNGVFWVKTSSSGYNSWLRVQWGSSGDIPLVSDVDGDGKADFIVWSSSSGLFWVKTSTSNYQSWFTQRWGSGTDVPLIGDVNSCARIVCEY